MKAQKNTISAALSTLAAFPIKPAVSPTAEATMTPALPIAPPTPTAADTPDRASAVNEKPKAPERIFAEPKVERVTVFLFEDDLAHVDKLIASATASGRRKVNQSQAIRALIRTGTFKPHVIDAVQAEDGRKKGNK